MTTQHMIMIIKKSDPEQTNRQKKITERETIIQWKLNLEGKKKKFWWPTTTNPNYHPLDQEEEKKICVSPGIP